MRGPRLNILLFVLTIFSTLFAGAYFIAEYDLLADFPKYFLTGLIKGIPFSLPLLLILGAHEFAHYYTSRRHNVDATLPYFIPFPNLFGTLGAVIKIKSRIYDRRALIDIGASGPLVGFVLSLVICAVGLSMSKAVAVKPVSSGEAILGGSLLYNLLLHTFVRADLTFQAVDLHPMAVAGWVGLFVTSINLMPVGQLDGGHIAFAFMPGKHRIFSKIFVVVLALMGIKFIGWLVWAVLLFFVGTKHPPVINSHEPIDPVRRAVGLASLIVFIITFPPVPLIIQP